MYIYYVLGIYIVQYIYLFIQAGRNTHEWPKQDLSYKEVGLNSRNMYEGKTHCLSSKFIVRKNSYSMVMFYST